MPPPDSRLMITIEDAVEAVYSLNVNVVGRGALRHEKPHKPCLLLAVLDLLATGKATPDSIPWNLELRERFRVYFEIVRVGQDQCNSELPFLHLKRDGWWQALRITPTGSIELAATPTVADANAGTVHAALSAGMELFVRTALDRMILRESLVSRYFPHARLLLMPLFAEPAALPPPASAAGNGDDPASSSLMEEDPVPAPPGRNSAFRRKILDIYDCQCAACGLRILLPAIDDLTFVDAAHLIPFNRSYNDHPTNGIALCKNHHWAMDRFLIAPTPDLSWIVSPHLDERRSDGERSLLALQGKRVLPPKDPAFAPTRDSLQWRVERLLA